MRKCGLPCTTDRTIFIVDFWYISGTLLLSTDGGNLSDISNHQHQVPDLWNDCNLPDLRCGSQNPADDSGHQESDSILIRYTGSEMICISQQNSESISEQM